MIRKKKESSPQPSTSSSVDPVELSEPEVTRESSSDSDSPKLEERGEEVQPKKKRKLYDVKYRSNWAQV